MTPDQSAALKQVREHQVREHLAALEVDIKAAESAGADKSYIIGCRGALANFFLGILLALGIPSDDLPPEELVWNYRK